MVLTTITQSLDGAKFPLHQVYLQLTLVYGGCNIIQHIIITYLYCGVRLYEGLALQYLLVSKTTLSCNTDDKIDCDSLGGHMRHMSCCKPHM